METLVTRISHEGRRFPAHDVREVTSALGKRPPQISHEEMRKRQQLFCEQLPTDAVAISHQ